MVEKKTKKTKQKSLLAKRGVYSVSECEMLLLRNVMDSRNQTLEYLYVHDELAEGWNPD